MFLRRKFITAIFILLIFSPLHAQFNHLDSNSDFNFYATETISPFINDINDNKTNLVGTTEFTLTSPYFSTITGLCFQERQFDLMCGIEGKYFINNFTFGVLALSNMAIYKKLGREFDLSLMPFADFKTRPNNYWQFNLKFGIGSMFSQIQYKKNGNMVWSKMEKNNTYLCDIFICKQFLHLNKAWFELRTYNIYDYDYGLSASFAFGYSYQIIPPLQAFFEINLNEIAFFTTLGTLRNISFNFGANWRIASWES